MVLIVALPGAFVVVCVGLFVDVCVFCSVVFSVDDVVSFLAVVFSVVVTSVAVVTSVVVTPVASVVAGFSGSFFVVSSYRLIIAADAKLLPSPQLLVVTNFMYCVFTESCNMIFFDWALFSHPLMLAASVHSSPSSLTYKIAS